MAEKLMLSGDLHSRRLDKSCDITQKKCTRKY